MLYEMGIPELQAIVWMGHSDTTMVHEVYTDLREEKQKSDAIKAMTYLDDFDVNQYKLVQASILQVELIHQTIHQMASQAQPSLNEKP